MANNSSEIGSVSLNENNTLCPMVNIFFLLDTGPTEFSICYNT